MEDSFFSSENLLLVQEFPRHRGLCQGDIHLLPLPAVVHERLGTEGAHVQSHVPAHKLRQALSVQRVSTSEHPHLRSAVKEILEADLYI